MGEGKKILVVVGIVAAVAFIYLLMSAMMPLFRETAQYATNATDNSTYPLAYAATASAPYWLYVIPGGVGVVAIVLTLRKKNIG